MDDLVLDELEYLKNKKSESIATSWRLENYYFEIYQCVENFGPLTR